MKSCWQIVKDFIHVRMILGFLAFMISGSAWASSSCIMDPRGLKELLYKMDIAPDWSEYIQGHWSVKLRGSGFYLFTYKGRYVFGINTAFSLVRDAQYISICPTKDNKSLLVTSVVRGEKVTLQARVSGNQLSIEKGPYPGLYTKRKKSLEQIQEEFKDLLQKL